MFAYACGIEGSRAIARAGDDHINFIALSGDTRPHFTTIAHYVSNPGDQVAPIFAAVLAVPDRQGLIGRDMFAIDGVKLPSNASKHRSARRADFERQAEKMERAAEAMLARHRAEDARDVEPTLAVKDVVRRERLCATQPSSVRGWRVIPMTDAGRRAQRASAIAPTTRAPGWRPARASHKATRGGHRRRRQADPRRRLWV